MQPIQRNINRLLNSKAAVFLKKSFFFAFLYSTMLYILVRLFFYDFPFTIAEGCELYSKILWVVWVFMIICKTAFASIVLLENNMEEIKSGQRMYVPVLKKSFLILVTAALTYTGKATSSQGTKKHS